MKFLLRFLEGIGTGVFAFLVVAWLIGLACWAALLGEWLGRLFCKILGFFW